MLDSYANFFVASTGASAAFIGLLFVALTIANQEVRDPTRQTRRDALAGSAFTQLIDAFFVSAVGLAGDANVFAAVNVVMACIGLWAHSQLLPAVIRSGIWSRSAPHRARNIALPVVSILVYLLQIGLAVSLVLSAQNAVLLRIAVLVLLGLYGSALARAWEITRV